MVTNKKVMGKAGSVPKGLAIGTVAALLITILFAVGMTQLILAEKISEMAMGYGAMIVMPLASAVSALIATGVIKRRRMQICLLAGLAYFIVLGIINVVFFGGQFSGVAVSVLLILLGAFAVGLLGARGEKGRGKRRKNYRPR